jgi:isopenicillin N synthase-like dioxygenase
MFTIGPKNPKAGFPPRLWPREPESFTKDWENYYDDMSDLASQILRAFAMAMELGNE